MFDSRFSNLEARLAQQTAELRAEFRVAVTEQKAELRCETAELKIDLQAELKTAVSDLRDRIGSAEKRLIGWMFGFWIGTVATMLAILRS